MASIAPSRLRRNCENCGADQTLVKSFGVILEEANPRLNELADFIEAKDSDLYDVLCTSPMRQTRIREPKEPAS